jgi:hypothetical protein
MKKAIFSNPSPGIGPTYAKYYDSHACHPTHYHYNGKRLHLQRLIEYKFRHKNSNGLITIAIWGVRLIELNGLFHSTFYTFPNKH